VYNPPAEKPRFYFRGEFMRRSRLICRLRVLPLLLCAIVLSCCQTSEDATAAAKQLATTSTDLANYYSALSQIVAGDIALGDLQNILLPHTPEFPPFTEANRARLMTTVSELRKRADLAKALQEVSNAFSSLTGSKASAEVSNAASKLGNELKTINALPEGPAMPSALGAAGKLIETLVQQHEEIKLARELDPTMSALEALFSQEKGAYDSLNQTYLNLAAVLATQSIKKGLVDETSILAPALQPFGLTGQLSSAASAEDTAALRTAAEAQVNARNKSSVAAHNAASDAMLKAITEMSMRIHHLATEGRMPSRGTPVTLTTVEHWIGSTFNTYFTDAAASAGTPAPANQ
jgi:hypothetical protein